MSNTNSIDHKIKEFLKKDKTVQAYSWNKPIIKSISAAPNPLFTNILKQYSAKDEYKDLRLIKILSDECFIFEFNQYDQFPLFSKPFERKILFKDEIEKFDETIKPNKEIQYSPSASYFFGIAQPALFKPPSPDFSMKKTQVLNVQLEKFEITGVDPFEPLTCTAFLYKDKNIISDFWNFVPECSIPLFEKLKRRAKLNHKASFMYKNVKSDPQLIILINRIAQTNRGAACDKLYTKNSTKKQKKASDSMSKSYKGLYCPFAITFASISDIITKTAKGKHFEMIQPCLFNFGRSDFSDFAEVYKSSSKFPFKITISAVFDFVTDPSLTANDGYDIIRSAQSPPSEPIFAFDHSLIVNLNSVLFSKKPGKDVFCKFSVQQRSKNNKALKIIHDKFSGKLVSYINSFCAQGDKNVSFNDFFLVDLPSDVGKDIILAFDFYSAHFNKGNPELIGSSVVPLFPKGELTKNNKQKINLFTDEKISFNNWEALNAQSFTTITVQVLSSLLFTDSKLDEFFDGKDLDFSSIHPIAIIKNLLPITEELVSRISKNSTYFLKAFEAITTAVPRFYHKMDDFLIFYALNFSLRNYINDKKNFKPIHNDLLTAWSTIIQEEKLSQKGSQRFDIYISDFLFALIIKSIFISCDNNIKDSLLNFAKIWSESIIPLIESGYIQAKKLCKSYSTFLIMLSDIKFYSLVIDCIEIQVKAFNNSQNDNHVLMYFLESVLTPKLFLVSVLYFDKIKDIIVELIAKIISNPDSLPLQDIFGIILNLMTYYDDKTCRLLVDHIISSLTIMCPLDSIPHINDEELKPSLIYFGCLLAYATKTSFNAWWNYLDKQQLSFFDSLHFLITKIDSKSLETPDKVSTSAALETIEQAYQKKSHPTANTTNQISSRSYLAAYKIQKGVNENHKSLSQQRSKEIAYSLQFSILNTLKIIYETEKHDPCTIYSPGKPLTAFSQITKVIYHIISSNFSIDSLHGYIEFLNTIAKDSIKLLFNQCCPVLPKFLIKIFQVLQYDNLCSSFIDIIKEADKLTFGNENRSNVALVRALYLAPYQVLSNIKCKGLNEFVQKLYKNETQFIQLSNSPRFEEKCDCLFEKFQLVKDSPDSEFEVLSELARLQHVEEYYAEEIQTYLLQASLVLEYLVILGKIPQTLFFEKLDKKDLLHASKIMNQLCSSTDLVKCQFKDIPIIPSFCDSYPFNVYSLIKLMNKTILICNETKYYEFSGPLLDIIWPILEYFRMFNILERSLKMQSQSFLELSELKPDEDRLFGKYFRVAFYGSIFNNNTNNEYIYREKKLTHLYEISSRLVSLNKAIYGDNNIELIKESGPVDISKLDKGKGYIQVTFVEPLIKRKSNKINNQAYDKFYYDTPFVKGDSKAQGTVETQWLKRTILSVGTSMPFIVKRQLVISTKMVESEPIRVSYRQLRERVDLLRDAITTKDMRKIQQLLHGSLLVQVNEGPSKMAEVFLKENVKETKYTTKLRQAFQEFLKVNKQGLDIHSKWCEENSEFIPLQHELQCGFDALSEKLKSFIPK